DSDASESSHDTQVLQTTKDGNEIILKILIIGDVATGKTSFIKRYVHKFFSTHYRATVGVDFALKVLQWEDGTIIRLQLWDLAGQERFESMSRIYFKEAVGAFVVFDVSNPKSFAEALKWKKDLDSKVTLPDGSRISCVLLANKCDLPKEGIANDLALLNEVCQDQEFVAWFYTSPKDNINIERAANRLVAHILKRLREQENGIVKDENNITLTAEKSEETTAMQQQEKKTCC
ncbi:ras-related protein Rab-32-like protein, partial [Dinothrombium tinctorium]